MFCENCGKQIKEGVNFCPYCGSRIMPAMEINNQQEDVEKSLVGVMPDTEDESGKLIVCSACGHKISNQAKTCPHCGNPTEYAKKMDENRAKSILYILPALSMIIGGIVTIVSLFNMSSWDFECLLNGDIGRVGSAFWGVVIGLAISAGGAIDYWRMASKEKKDNGEQKINNG